MARTRPRALGAIALLVVSSGVGVWASVPRSLGAGERAALASLLGRVDARIEEADARWSRVAPQLSSLEAADARCPIEWHPPAAPASFGPERWVTVQRAGLPSRSQLAEGLRGARAQLHPDAAYTPAGAEDLLARARGLAASPPPELVLVVTSLVAPGLGVLDPSDTYELEGTVFLVGDEVVCAARVRSFAEAWQVELEADAGAEGGTSSRLEPERVALRWARGEAVRALDLGLRVRRAPNESSARER
ncbi:MAG: hypothetical protein U0353_21005 [Sandaracinus sp.]|jgi:hypothetical protein